MSQELVSIARKYLTGIQDRKDVLAKTLNELEKGGQDPRSTDVDELKRITAEEQEVKLVIERNVWPKKISNWIYKGNITGDIKNTKVLLDRATWLLEHITCADHNGNSLGTCDEAMGDLLFRTADKVFYTLSMQACINEASNEYVDKVYRDMGMKSPFKDAAGLPLIDEEDLPAEDEDEEEDLEDEEEEPDEDEDEDDDDEEEEDPEDEEEEAG